MGPPFVPRGCQGKGGRWAWSRREMSGSGAEDPEIAETRPKETSRLVHAPKRSQMAAVTVGSRCRPG